ncbi:hypothetical protein L596_005841 [Steinernema carpocapsae]|uniref:Uncharacterized protein n=1 Tax=Steinernema carpocapsae TaxID=34508 RepID=A0A4V6I8T2_STECR|nr:hypothetical protein L596_005841 [Steinernema carpocapsae]
MMLIEVHRRFVPRATQILTPSAREIFVFVRWIKLKTSPRRVDLSALAAHMVIGLRSPRSLICNLPLMTSRCMWWPQKPSSRLECLSVA